MRVLSIANKSSVRTDIVMMTPKVAHELLSRNRKNRPLSKNYVETLAGAMMRGEWKLNGESIKLDVDNQLLDGQHRLTGLSSLAEVEGCENLSVPMLPVTGLPRETFDTIDQGKKRRASDILAIGGELNTKTLAAAARAIHFIELCMEERGGLTTVQIERIIAAHPTMRDWVSRVISSKAKFIVPSGKFAAVLTLGAKEFGDDVAELFCIDVSTGENLSATNPAFLLREKFISAKNSRMYKLPTFIQTPLIVKAWNAYALGKKMSLLKYTAGESHPEMARRPK